MTLCSALRFPLMALSLQRAGAVAAFEPSEGASMTGTSRFRPVLLAAQVGMTSLSKPNTIALFAITTPSARR